MFDAYAISTAVTIEMEPEAPYDYSLSAQLLEQLMAEPKTGESRYVDADRVSVKTVPAALVDSAHSWFAESLRRLTNLQKLDRRWCNSDVAAPNETATELATVVLKSLAAVGFRPSYIDPSSDEGVCVSFRHGVRYADIECFNTGEILAITSSDDVEQPQIWQLDILGIHAAVAKIHNHILG